MPWGRKIKRELKRVKAQALRVRQKVRRKNWWFQAQMRMMRRKEKDHRSRGIRLILMCQDEEPGLLHNSVMLPGWDQIWFGATTLTDEMSQSSWKGRRSKRRRYSHPTRVRSFTGGLWQVPMSKESMALALLISCAPRLSLVGEESR